MSDLRNPASRYIFFVLQIFTPLILLLTLSFLDPINLVPSLALGELLTVSLAAMQVTLAALAISIGIAAIVGFKAIQQAARDRAGEVAAEVATEEIKAYISTQASEELKDEIRRKLEENNGELAQRGQPERRANDVGGSAVSS